MAGGWKNLGKLVKITHKGADQQVQHEFKSCARECDCLANHAERAELEKRNASKRVRQEESEQEPRKNTA